MHEWMTLCYETWESICIYRSYKFLVQTCWWWFYKISTTWMISKEFETSLSRTLKQSELILYMCYLTDMACPLRFCDLYIAANLYRKEILPLTCSSKFLSAVSNIEMLYVFLFHWLYLQGSYTCGEGREFPGEVVIFLGFDLFVIVHNNL